jgi:hypothetical protein
MTQSVPTPKVAPTPRPRPTRSPAAQPLGYGTEPSEAILDGETPFGTPSRLPRSGR